MMVLFDLHKLLTHHRSMVRDIRKIKGESIKETDVLEDAKSKAKYVIPLPPVTDNYRKKQILIYEGTLK